MLGRTALALTALFLLAGCSSPSPSGAHEASGAPSTTFSIVGDNRIAAPLFTDTFHLLAQPDVTPVPPTADEPLRVPVTTAFQPADIGQPPENTWDLVMPDDVRGFVGTARVWVEVKGPLMGNPFSLTTGGCFWSIEGVVGESDFVPMGCLPDDLQIAEGVHELVFTFSHPDRSWPAGTMMRVQFNTYEVTERAPGTTVKVLTGSAQYDSAIQVYGLALPLDGQVLLSS